MSYIDLSEILFILNPNSGMKNVNSFICSIQKQDKALSYTVSETREDLQTIFDSEMEKKKVFVVVGGDGTVNEITKFLVGRTDKFLAVYPNGSGNGFANELGFKRNLNNLLKDIQHGDTMDLDVIQVNNSLFVNMAGVGMDSHVAHAFGRSKKRGFIRYSLLTAKSALTFKPFHATIQVNGRFVEGDYRMITIANTRQFGNNARIAPMSKPNDGLFELVLVKPFPLHLYPKFATGMFLGKFQKSKYVEYIQSKDPVQLNTAYNHFHLDGEPVSFEGKVCLSLYPQKIRVIRTSYNNL